MFKYSCYGTTFINERRKNEDYFQIFAETIGDVDYLAAIVCDGIGSMNHSEEIAKECSAYVLKLIRRRMLELIKKYKSEDAEWSLWWKEELKEQILEAEEYLTEKFAHISIGTTITLVFLFDHQYVFLADCGDSPCYLLKPRKKEIQLWSRIRNLAGENLEFYPEFYTNLDSLKKEHRRRLTAGIGFQNSVEEPEKKIHVDFIALTEDVLIALGSDGAFSAFSEEKIYEYLMNMENEEYILVERAERLMSRAREEEQERDNQTLILIDVKQEK